jgi:hypothetical protein
VAALDDDSEDVATSDDDLVPDAAPDVPRLPPMQAEGTIKTSQPEKRAQLARDRNKIRLALRELCEVASPHYDLNVTMMYESATQRAADGILCLDCILLGNPCFMGNVGLTKT